MVVALTVRQRCFYLFCALLLLILLAPLLENTTRGRLALNGISLLVLLSGAAAIGNGRLRHALGLLLGVPAAALQAAGLLFEKTNLLVVSWGFSAAFYLLVRGLPPDLCTAARSAHDGQALRAPPRRLIMLAVLWDLLLRHPLLVVDPGALTMGGTPISARDGQHSLMYLQLSSTLTSTGMSDILPLQPDRAHALLRSR